MLQQPKNKHFYFSRDENNLIQEWTKWIYVGLDRWISQMNVTSKVCGLNVFSLKKIRGYYLWWKLQSKSLFKVKLAEKSSTAMVCWNNLVLWKLFFMKSFNFICKQFVSIFEKELSKYLTTSIFNNKDDAFGIYYRTCFHHMSHPLYNNRPNVLITNILPGIFLLSFLFISKVWKAPFYTRWNLCMDERVCECEKTDKKIWTLRFNLKEANIILFDFI